MVYWSPGQGYGSTAYNERWMEAQGIGGSNMWPLIAAGAAAQVGGSIYSTYASTKRAKKSLKFAKKMARKQIQWRVKDAKRAGLHPLAALGMTPASGPGIMMPDYSGYAEAGAAINQALQNMGQSAISKKLAEQEVTSRDLDIDYKRLRNQAALMENMGQRSGVGATYLPLGGPAPAGQQIDVQADQPTAVNPGSSGGLSAAVHPAEMFTAVENPRYGSVLIPTLTQQLTESLEDNLMFKIPYYATKIDQYWQGFSAKYGTDPVARAKWMQFWDRRLPDPGQGLEWDYHPAGYFYRQRVGTRARILRRMYETKETERQIWQNHPGF